MPDLQTELNNCPVLKAALVWQSGNGETMSYVNWPQAKKQRISEIYYKLCRNDTDLGLNLPTEQNINDHDFAFFTDDQAFDVYAAHAAHCLCVEFNRLVPWSVVGRPPDELAVLLSSASYHSIILPSQRADYSDGIQAGRDFQEIPENRQLGELNGDPRVAFRFVTGQTLTGSRSLVGENEYETLINLTVWLRDNVGHGHVPRENTRYYRWLENRLTQARGTSVALANVGCHSASKLMVDLTRSINIPLLHVRTQISNTTEWHLFSRTDGGLIYGWGRHHDQPALFVHPLILWHTDEIYAVTGEPSFPIDSEGHLLPETEAKRAYFEQRWRTPEQLAQAGFNYNLHRVYPDQGFGANSNGQFEDRADYGMMAGYWTKAGTSDLPQLMRIEEHYAICGYYLLNLYCTNSVLTQLNNDIQATRRSLSPVQIPQTHSIYEYEARAQMGVAALGGCEALNRIVADWNANRGSGVMRRKFVPLLEKRRRVIKSKTPPIKARKPGIKRPK